MIRCNHGLRWWAASAGGVRWKNQKAGVGWTFSPSIIKNMFVCKCCFLCIKWQRMSTAKLLNRVNVVFHDYVDVYHKYLSLHPSGFLLSSSFCPLSHSSLSISFYQPTRSNSSLTFSIPHSILPACPLSFFPDLIIYFCFSHIHLSTLHSPLSFFPPI